MLYNQSKSEPPSKNETDEHTLKIAQPHFMEVDFVDKIHDDPTIADEFWYLMYNQKYN